MDLPYPRTATRDPERADEPERHNAPGAASLQSQQGPKTEPQRGWIAGVEGSLHSWRLADCTPGGSARAPPRQALPGSPTLRREQRRVSDADLGQEALQALDMGIEGH